jgi:hypothetical protein
LQNAFDGKNPSFGSEKAMIFWEECVEIISYETIGESRELAIKYGPSEGFNSSDWAKSHMWWDILKDQDAEILVSDAFRDTVKRME